MKLTENIGNIVRNNPYAFREDPRIIDNIKYTYDSGANFWDQGDLFFLF